MKKLKEDVLSEAVELIRGEEVATLQTLNRNLLEENHRLRAAEGRLLEERGRILGFFDLKDGDKKPRDIVWLIEETVRKSKLDVHRAEVTMLERIRASIEEGYGMDASIGNAIDRVKKASYDKGWEEGIEKYKSALKSFFEILERRLK